MGRDFIVKMTFPLQAFLDGCYDAGIKLYCREEGDVVQGGIVETPGSLKVILGEKDEALMEIIAGKVLEYNQ